MGAFSDGLTRRLDALQAIPVPDWIAASLASRGYVIRCGRCGKDGWPDTLDGVWSFLRRHIESCAATGEAAHDPC